MAEINERPSTSVDCPPLSPTSAGNSAISDEVQAQANDFSEKMYAFINGEIQGTIEDYKMLEQMNNSTSQRYSDMTHVAETISAKLGQLRKKYEEIQPYLDQVNEIDAASRRLDDAVGMLEQYVATLEKKLQKFQQSSS